MQLMRVRTFQGYVALLAAVLALAVGGCGGGNDDSASDSQPSSVARGTTGQKDATRPQRPSDGTGGAEVTTEPKQRDSSNNGAPGGNDPEPPPAGSTPEKEKPKPPQRTLDAAEAKRVGRELAKQARIVCKALTLEGLAKDYDIKSPDPDEVAEAYAATYPVAIREAVAAGCKKGLLESR